MWEDAYVDWWWLDRYGLTPDEVGRIPAASAARIPDIAAMVDHYREELSQRGTDG